MIIAPDDLQRLASLRLPRRRRMVIAPEEIRESHEINLCALDGPHESESNRAACPPFVELATNYQPHRPLAP